MAAWKRARRDQRGSVAIITALMAPIMVGALAIAVDVTYWRYRATNLQLAADAAALSLALDLSNDITTKPTLETNAQGEASKHGCADGCSVAVTYPYKGDANLVEVVVTDQHAARFFSGIYDSADKKLTGRAVAQRQMSSSGGGTYAGSGCVLALEESWGEAIFVRNHGVVIEENCEIISNSSAGNSIQLDANARVLGRATAYGNIASRNGAYIAERSRNPYQPRVPDPYASQVSSWARKHQWKYVGPGNGWRQDECLEKVDNGGNIQNLNFGSDLTNQLYNPQAVGYSSYMANGRRWHNFGGGGGRFCQNTNISNVGINFGAGIWFFSQDINISNTIINGTGQDATTINRMYPMVGGQPINGVVLVFASQNTPNFGNNTEFHLRAPSTGPASGIALTHASDDNNYSQWNISNGILMEYAGVLYLPKKRVLIQNGGRFYALAPPGGNATMGCSQIVGRTVEFTNDVTLGNECLGVGLKAWGTDETKGWQLVGGGGGGSGAGGSLSIRLKE